MRLHRTPVTWAIYGMNGAWASFIYLSGPVSPVLVEDLGISLAAAGLTGTALAAGIMTASVTAPRAVRRLGRDVTMRAGLLVVIAGLVGMILVPQVASGSMAFGSVLFLIWIASTGGGTVLNASTVRLSDLHPEQSARAITEANAAAAWVGLLSPLLLGVALGAGLGWRAGIAVCLVAALVALVGLVVADRMQSRPGAAEADATPSAQYPVEQALEMVYEPAPDEPAPDEPAPDEPAPDGPAVPSTLPRVFRWAMLALFSAVATEFSINYWGSTLIEEQTGSTASAATSAMAASVAGVAVGRTVGSALTVRLGSHQMLIGGFVVALLGFGVLWTSTTLGMAVVGLFVAGLGIATLFPLILDRGIVLSAGKPDLAMARSSLVLGLAVATAPFALGALGSVMSVSSALLLVPVVVVVGLIGVLASRPPAVRIADGAH